jgi:rRNA biogenesis protein RRP5
LFSYPADDSNINVNASSRFGLSFKDSIVSWSPFHFSEQYGIGRVLDKAIVERVDVKAGVLFRLGTLSNPLMAYAPLNRLSDDESKTQVDTKKYILQSSHRCRVISQDMVDGMVRLSLQPSVLNASFFRHEDIKPGMIINDAIVAKLDSITDNLIVHLCMVSGIRALCPKTHLADVPSLSHPERHFNEGQKIKVRVLSCDSVQKKVFVTHKRTLLNTTLPVLSSSEQITSLLTQAPKEGLWAHGVITGIKPAGCVVHFFGNLRGFIHVSHLSEQAVASPESLFSVGQVVKCRVIDTGDQGLRLSLRPPSAQDMSISWLKVLHSDKLAVGAVIPECKIVNVINSGVVVSISHEDKEIPGFIDQAHLSDYEELSTRVSQTLLPGNILHNLVVIRHEKRSLRDNEARMMMLTLSAKTSVKLRFCKYRFEDLAIGKVLVGWVQAINDIGAFVALGPNLTALLPRHDILELYPNIEVAAGVYGAGSTLVCVVAKLDTEKRRVTLSVKPSAFPMNEELHSARCLMTSSFFTDLCKIQSSALLLNNAEYWSGLQVMSSVNVFVKQILPQIGILAKVNEVVDGLFAIEHFGKSMHVEVGDSVKGTVLDMDAEKYIVDLVNINITCKNEESLVELVNATVLLTKPDYVIIGLENKRFGFILCRSLPNVPKVNYQLGQKLQARFCGVDEYGRSLYVRDSRVVSVRHKRDVSQSSAVASNDVEVQVGSIVKATIKTIKQCQMNVSIECGIENEVNLLRGRVSMTELADSATDLPNLDDQATKNIFRALGFKSGDIIEAKVIGVHDAKTHRWLPISHMGGTRSVLELSMRPTVMKADLSEVDLKNKTAQDFSVGSVVDGFVQEYVGNSSRFACWVQLTPNIRASLPVMELTTEIDVLHNWKNFIYPGKHVRCQVASSTIEDSGETHLTVSIRSMTLGRMLNKVEDFEIGMNLCGRVISTSPSAGISIQLTATQPMIVGRVGLLDISDSFCPEPTSTFSIGQYVKCKIIFVDKKQGRIDLTIRPSELTTEKTTSITDPIIRHITDLSEGQKVRGYVTSVSTGGVFVAIGHQLVARVLISDLSDEFVSDWKSLHKLGELVHGRIKKINVEDGHIGLSLRLSDVDPDAYRQRQSLRLQLEDLQLGQVISGTVCRVENYGLFVNIDKSGSEKRPLRGLCHRRELFDDDSATSQYEVGDRVKAIVLNIDVEAKKIDLGMKSSYFTSEVLDIDEMQEDETESWLISSEVDYAAKLIVTETEEINGEVADETEEVDYEAPALVLDAGFSWTGDWKLAENKEDSSATELDSDSDFETTDAESGLDKKSRSKARREKTRLKREEEARIAQREAAAISGQPNAPDTVDDFNRLVASSPNSSYIWIQFMAFYINLVEIEKSRQVAERALKTISFREEKEKFNVWIAYLNLENRFGSPDSLKAVLNRAVQYNEPKHVYLSLLKIYEKTGKFSEAEELLNSVLFKKFKGSSKVWTQTGQFYYTRNMAERSRELLKQCITFLPKRKRTLNTFLITISLLY